MKLRWFNWFHRKKYQAWEDFQPNLQVADIIFIRVRGSFVSWVIRRFTRSYWSHLALVFAVPNKKKLFNNYLIVEANRRGMEVHRLQEYSKRLDIHDIGVKRVPGLDKKTRDRVVAFMLNNVDKPYDFTRLLGFLFKSFDWDLSKGLVPLFVDKEDFVCSSFIQKAFYQAMDDKRKTSVIFSNDVKLDCHGNFLGDKNIDQVLDYVTPRDVARSEKCEWLFNKHY